MSFEHLFQVDSTHVCRNDKSTHSILMRGGDLAMMRMSLLVATAMLAPLAASAQPAAPAPPTGPVQPLEYAVKFVCGRTLSAAARPQAATGNYYTMINVHNPGRRIEVTHKVALAQVIGQPAHMTSFS